MGLFVDGLSGRLLLLEGGVVTDAKNAERVVSRKIFETSMSALKVVRDIDADTVGLADCMGSYIEAAASGITLTATAAGERGLVLNEGYLADDVFVFPLGTVLMLGEDGGIVTELLANSTNQTILGKGVGTGGIYMQIEKPLIIE